MRFIVPAALPRLARLLEEVGLAVDVRADVAAVEGPLGPIPLRSGFPLHQLREVLRAARLTGPGLTARGAVGQRWQAILQELHGAPLVVGVGEPDPAQDALPDLEPALDLHQAMEVLLVAHRVALMDADLPRAAAALSRFSAAMLAHVEVEDRLVMPRYRDAAPAGGWARGADPDIVSNEHEKIQRRLPELLAAVREVEAAGLAEAERKVACLDLLDREKVFADLLEHHDLRERAHVYPRLEVVLGPEERQAMALCVLDGFTAGVA